MPGGQNSNGQPPGRVDERFLSVSAAALDSQNRPLTQPLLADLDDEQITPTGPFGSMAPGLNVYATPTVPTNLGAGTNEDRIILVNPADLICFLKPPQFIVAQEASADLPLGQIRVVVYGYAASVPHRYPTGIGILGGSGIAAPAGF
jgi:hypothetical protein